MFKIKKVLNRVPFCLLVLHSSIDTITIIKTNYDISHSTDGETRTHTGERPLPPQGSVSTIPPHPHIL